MLYLHRRDALPLCDSVKRMQTGRRAGFEPSMHIWDISKWSDTRTRPLSSPVKNVSLPVKSLNTHVCMCVCASLPTHTLLLWCIIYRSFPSPAKCVCSNEDALCAFAAGVICINLARWNFTCYTAATSLPYRPI